MNSSVWTRGRQRYTPDQRRGLLKEYEAGNSTQRAFTEAHDLSLTTLQKWLRQSRQKKLPDPTGETPRLAEIPFQGFVSGTKWGAEVLFSNGSTVRFSENISPALAQGILKALPC